MSTEMTAFKVFIEEYENKSKVFFTKDNKGEIWIRATQACEHLEFSDPHRTVKKYLKEHQYQEFREGLGRPALYISESGFYRLVLKSKSVRAEVFIDWLTEDVLPKIHSQGNYATGDVSLGDLLNINSLLLCAVISETPKTPELQDLINENSPHLVFDNCVGEVPTVVESEESTTATWLDKAEISFARLFV